MRYFRIKADIAQLIANWFAILVVCLNWGCVHAYLRRQNQRLKRWFKTPIQNAVNGEYCSCFPREHGTAHCSRPIVRAQWTGKAFIWRHLNVVICDFAFMLHQNQRFALTTIVNAHFWAAFMLILRRQNQRFETLIQTPIQNALHGSTVHASLEKKTISWACTAHCSRLLSSSSEPERRYMTSLNVVICDFAFMLPPESAFCSNHDRKRTFLGVLNQRFETTFIRK